MKKVKKICVTLLLAIASVTASLGFAACVGVKTGDTPLPSEGGHTHTYTETVSEQYLKSAATCTQKAVYYKSCSCGEKGTETFEYGDVLGHSYTNYTYNNDATCEKNGTETATCDNGCQNTDTRTKGNSALGHDYATPTYAWNGDKCTATRICSHDNTHKEIETVTATYEKDTEATCTVPEKGHYVATFKNSTFTTQTTEKDSVSNGKELGHSFTKYVSDKNATCAKDGTETAHCDRTGCTVIDTVTDVGSKLQSGITFKTLSVNGENVFGKVSNATETFSFIHEISTVGKMKFVVSLDIYGSQQVATKTIPLTEGDNIVYVIELLDGEPKKVYTVNVRRRPIHNVTFYTNNGSKVNSQQIEEDSCASIPKQIPTRTGYTFNKWKYDFTTPITDNTTISADWNTVPYKISYDLNGGTIEKGNPSTYDIEQNVTLTVNPTKIGYTFAGWSNNGEITKGSTGEKTFTASWSADVKLSSDGKTVTGLNNTVTNLVILSEYNGITVTSIGDYAFEDCSSLTSITIGDSVTSIGDYAFRYCSSLTSITIPNSVTSIGDSAFEDCSSLEEMTLPFVGASKMNWGYKAVFGYIFGYTTNSSSSEVSGATYQYCGSYCYHYYIPTSLKSVTITGGDIPYDAFYNCKMLTSITIPNSVTSIGSSAFSGCNLKYNEYDNALYLGNKTNKYLCLIKVKSTYITSCNINENCKLIHSSAFNGCKSLTSITIPNSVTSIRISAFYNCSSLASVTIGNSVTSIGISAFYNCSSLKSITIPNTVTGIGSSAFDSCSSLASVTIGNSVTSIEDSAFKDCSSLTEIKYNATECADLRSYSYNYVFYNAGKDGTGIKVTIGKNVKKIPAYLFCPYEYSSSYSPKITEVVFEEGSVCESIGKNAFNGCSSLKSITIPNTVTGIGRGAFDSCSSLTSVTIGNSVTSIGDYAFRGCSSLTSVTIGNSVTSIGDYAFSGCSSLTSVTIGNSVTSIGDYAFRGCSSLTSVTFVDTSTWYRTSNLQNWQNKTNGTSTNVTDASTNATYFKSTYCWYYWYKV